jgi:hypothetical protein
VIRGHELENRDAGASRRPGRPVLSVPSARVQITLPPRVFDVYERAANERGKKLARLIREVLEQRIRPISRHK